MKDLDALIASITTPKMLTVELDEGQRQLVLMALAALAVERPGWDMALSEIAAKMDNVQTVQSRVKQRRLDALHYGHQKPQVGIGKPIMYETFKTFRASGQGVATFTPASKAPCQQP